MTLGVSICHVYYVHEMKGDKFMEKFCQSCGMPLTKEVLGTNADESANQDYCSYCYENGAFTSDCTMDEMIEFCVPMMKDIEPEEARKMMKQFFPQLKRWHS